MKKIAVYCSASDNVPRKYHEAAKALVDGLCRKGYAVVSGGSWRGVMGAVSDAAEEAGGYHKGVLPRFLGPYIFERLSETVWTETMSERKENMRKDTVASIALPGGIGTLDELIETMVLIKLGQYKGKLYAFNQDGFYEPFKALLDHYVAEGMLIPEDRELIRFADSPEDILAEL